MPDLLQRCIALVGLLITGPLMLAVGVVIRLDSDGPAMYRAARIGTGGRQFTCLKLRTMTSRQPNGGPAVTTRNDSRVTRVGRVVRRWRLDELPQLWNVVRGEMRLVGPRPEDPAFADLTLPLHRKVFTATPGITGLAQLIYLDEASWLSSVDPERTYREVVLPAKLSLDSRYLDNRSLVLDLRIIVATMAALRGRRIALETVQGWVPATPPLAEPHAAMRVHPIAGPGARPDSPSPPNPMGKGL